MENPGDTAHAPLEGFWEQPLSGSPAIFPLQGLIIQGQLSPARGKARMDFVVLSWPLTLSYSAFSNCSLGAPHLGHSLGRHRPSLVSPQAVHLHTGTLLHLRFPSRDRDNALRIRQSLSLPCCRRQVYSSAQEMSQNHWCLAARGIRQPRPNPRLVTRKPGAACRRLYSLLTKSRSTSSTVSWG